ncbi:alpha/beta hydrolase, partial [Mesorhizobium sp. M1A.T.Ca.IN.004.03.1.1]
MLAEVSAFLAPLAAVIGYSSYKARQFEHAYPNIGELTDVGGYCMNAVHVARPENADLPALVFIHGASGNLLDQVVAFRAALEGRAEMLFVDRPGHGYSE